MTPVVREVVEDYGAIHDEELVVVVPGTLQEHNCTHTQQPSRTPSWITKKKLCAGSIIRLTAAVASSVFLLFLSVQASSGPARTAEAFLLQAYDGATNDNTCLPASGLYPTGVISQDDDTNNKPYVTCYSLRGGRRVLLVQFLLWQGGLETVQTERVRCAGVGVR